MIGPRIAALRRASGISQSDMADMLRISASAIGMYEQGRREPALDVLTGMAEIFGVSIDFMVTGKACCDEEEERLVAFFTERVNCTDMRLANRRVRPFSREELAALFAAMLMEP